MTFVLPPDNRTAAERVQWAADTFGDQLAVACSTAIEDGVLVHLAAATGRPLRVFLLDTGRLHPETYDTFHRLALAYPGLRYEVFLPRAEDVEALVAVQGLFGFRDSLDQRHACCQVRKLEPLRRALQGCRAWLTGLRREQSPTRAGLASVQSDGGDPERLKIAPLLDWSQEQVLAFAAEHGIPTHPLHARGYPSIGCAPCTRPVEPGADLRSGRWWWEPPEHKECGLHRPPLPPSESPSFTRQP